MVNSEQRFVSLDIRNVMGIKAARIDRAGPVTTVGGKNKSGKSSAIKSLWMILGGGSSTPDKPLRDGATKGSAVLELTDYRCELKLTEKSGTKLTVTSKDGGTVPAPATFLKSLTAGKAFDPMAFLREEPAKQLEILRRLVGLDLSKEDVARQAAYNKRTDVGREIKRLEGAVASLPEVPDGTPDAEVSVADLTTEIDRRRDVNAENAAKREALTGLRSTAVSLQAVIKETETKLAKLREELEATSTEGKRLSAEAKALVDMDVEEVRKQIANAEQTNRAVRAKAGRAKLQAELDAAIDESEKLSQRITEIDTVKSEAIASARFPVDGLGFGDGCVLYHGRPLAQACGLESMQVAIGVGMVLNPGIKLLAVDNGEALDAEQHAALVKTAEQHGCDLLIARVSTGPECSIILSDGEVAGVETQPTEAA